MTKEELKAIKQEIDDLINKIKQWNYEYYVLDQSSVSDSVYDQHYRKLVALEEQYPQFIRNDSPTKTVGAQITDSSLRKIAHQVPMLSLANAFNQSDLIKFDQQIKKITSKADVNYVCELKIDGLSITVTYQDAKLKLAATRGDGTLGEDITENLKEIKTIPITLIDCPIKNLEVRGEVFLSKNDFQILNQEQKELNLPLFANPRNAAAGTLRQLDKTIVAKRKLDAFLYYYVDALKDGIKTHSEALQQLTKYHFNVNKEWKLCQNIDQVWQYIDDYQSKRNNLAYEIDGIVIKVDDLSLYQILGNTNKAPRWAIAYKFPAVTTTTKLLEIFPTVGRTGRITYNAKLEPVLLSGSKISYATLHNGDYIIEKDLRESDLVEIKKAGDIIPEVIKVIVSARQKDAKKFSKATHCPKCHSVLEQVEDEVDQYCVNTNCPARILKSLIHFCSRNAMNITGLKEKILARFLNLKWIHDVADIYQLVNYRQEIINLEKFGEKSFNNLVSMIIKSKSNSLERLLFALGIRHVGEKNAEILAANFKTLENLMKANHQQLSEINDVGPTIATSVIDYFANQDNQQLIKKLAEFKVNFSFIEQEIKQEQIFTNTTFVITGTLSKSRDYFAGLLKSYGASVTNTISSNTNYLLAGKEPGSKLEKARELNVKIISEEELFSIINKK
ncbi:NAD-dependent DNA ligase LigA [Spiroplasma platyhelix]|uniref:DNA ligase n=1 Tax=Spiroplasma platyhelix PALS-1 TaxID=1276218 RepID=A0A846TRN8_9MOLU|nr:NAD-dependent DNA ligase LigA [Spiroplasma platyhelix]MBE4703802.1 DNA ligase [Spiroplasma platyhelix PALS-1]NKE38175.1 NAD-dependent DNA ligase LigA [Spiroplasma platyhelix PALS-1]UJB29060.1 NAD-dependent DNA ligase [Spiroplasma platyhelix PALS-1]